MTSNWKSNGAQSARRSYLLAGVGTGVLATMFMNPAHAGQSSSTSGTEVVTGAVVAHHSPSNIAPVNGAILPSTLEITTLTQTGSNNEILDSVLDSDANANDILHILDVGLAGISMSGDGIASLIVEDNSGAITSSSSSNVLQILIDGFQTGNATLAGNEITASTGINTASTSIQGTVPSGYSSTAAGSALLTDTGAPGGDLYAAQGSLVAATVQGNIGTGSSAQVLSNDLRIDVDTLGTLGTISSAASVDDNLISADYSGNDATTELLVEAGDNPLFAGSAGVLSFQYNGLGTHAGDPEALNEATLVSGAIGSSGAAGAPLAGSLSVSDNAISASASGNSALGSDGEAGNRILIEGGMSFDGPASPQSASALVSPGSTSVQAGADLAITSVQTNNSAGVLNARVEGAEVVGFVESSSGGTVDVSGNLITSSASSNAATSSITNGGSSPSFAGSVAVVNEQDNIGGGTRANTRDSAIHADVGNGAGDLVNNGTTVTVGSNEIRASATGNSSAQLIDLEAVAIDMGGGNATLVANGPPAFVSSTGGATITNLQVNAASPVTARNRLSDISLSANVGTGAGSLVEDSTLAVAANVEEVVATGNGANNDLMLTGNEVGTGAGINSGQFNDADSDISARFRGSASLDVSFNAVATDLSVSGNRQQSVAAGNRVDNNATIDANAIVAAAGLPGVVASSMDGASLNSDAAYAVQSGQAQLSDVEARVRSDGALLSLSVGGALRQGGSAAIDGNAVGAGAFGNDAANSLSVTVGNLTVTGDAHANVAALTNGQTLGASVAAEVAPEASAIQLSVGNDVRQTADVSVSGNGFEALAFGNRTTTNGMEVDGTNITAAAAVGDVRGSIDSSGPVEANAAFVVQNGQVNDDGTIDATLVSNGGADRDILVDLGRRLNDSSATVQGNQFSAAATSNSASSSLALDSSGLSATAAVQNYQETHAGVTATAGGQGSGVLIEIGQIGANLIQNSSATIAGNSRKASAIGNDAAATLDVSGTNIVEAGNNVSATADSDGAAADFIVGNSQNADGSAIAAAAASGLTIVNIDETNVDSSTLAITGNSQSAFAIANTGATRLTIDGTNLQSDEEAVSSALLSVQRGDDVTVGANSLLAIIAPAEVASSSVDLSGNTNTALGVINDVSNRSAISATNIAGANAAGAEVLAGAESTVEADHVLNNIQTASGTLASNAATSIGNGDVGDVGTAASSLTASGNRTVAESTANRATNTMSAAGTASNAASAALANHQSSETTVISSATSTVGIALSGDGVAALGSSGVVLNDNGTSALARGNAATNTLNYAGSSLSPASPVAAGSSLTPAGDLSANATALVLNSQHNQGPIAATASHTVTVALNGVAASPAATDSSVSVSGHSTSATAFGNYAMNTLTMTGMNNGATGAVSSNQVNSGAISATAGATISIGATGGPVTGGSMGIVGNSISASAIGNSASTTITGN